MFACCVMLDVPRDLVFYVSELLHWEQRQRGARRGTRLLTCYQRAVFVLTWFRDNPGCRAPRVRLRARARHLLPLPGRGDRRVVGSGPDLHEALERKVYAQCQPAATPRWPHHRTGEHIRAAIRFSVQDWAEIDELMRVQVTPAVVCLTPTEAQIERGLARTKPYAA